MRALAAQRLPRKWLLMLTELAGSVAANANVDLDAAGRRLGCLALSFQQCFWCHSHGWRCPRNARGGNCGLKRMADSARRCKVLLIIDITMTGSSSLVGEHWLRPTWTRNEWTRDEEHDGTRDIGMVHPGDGWLTPVGGSKQHGSRAAIWLSNGNKRMGTARNAIGVIQREGQGLGVFLCC